MSAEAQPAGMAVRRARQALTLEVTCLATAAAAAHTVVELAATIQSTCHFLLLLVNRRPALSTRGQLHAKALPRKQPELSARPATHLDGPMTDAVIIVGL